MIGVRAATGVATVMKLFAFGNISNQKLVSESVSEDLGVSPSNRAVASSQRSNPKPATGIWLWHDLVSNTVRQLVQHERRLAASP
jgi:hypothetical protein